MEQTEMLVAVIPDMTVAKEKKLGAEVSDIEARAGLLVIATDEDFQKAGEFGRLLKKKSSEITEFFKPMKESAHQAHKAICDREKAMLSPLRNAEQIIKRAMGSYQEEKERKRREQEEAMRKAAQEESERKFREALALEETGDIAGAEAAMVDAEIMDEASRYTITQDTKPKAQGVSTTKDWEIVSIDGKAVPLAVAGVELRPVDRAAVMRLIRSSKGKIDIPGIVYREVAKLSFRR